MIEADIVSTLSSYSLILGIIVVGAVILGVIFLIVLGILLGRRVSVNMKTGGAIALTLASILFLSGVWCMVLSPSVTYSETKDSFYRNISIEGSESWGYSIGIENGDSLRILLDGTYIRYNMSKLAKIDMYIYDPNDNVIWVETNISYTHFNTEVSTSGVHKVEVQNPNPTPIQCFIQITVTAKVTYRPLEPLGSWLTLMSLPILGLGLWASGVFTIVQKPKVRKLVD